MSPLNEPLVPVLLLSTMFLFHRWKDTGDRSAYAVAAICAVGVAFLAVVQFLDPLRAASDALPGFHFGLGELFHLVVSGALLVFLLRPLVLTGVFLFAPQTRVRKLYHKLETSWQYGLGTWFVAFFLRFAAGEIGPHL